MATKVLTKDPDELKLYGIEFAGVLADGDALTGTPILSTLPSGLTLGTPLINGTLVQFTIEGGTENTMYVITCTVTTIDGHTHEGCVRLFVKDCSAFVEMIMMTRVLINDLDDENYSYNDTRLIEILVVSAKYVQQDIDLQNDYTINVRQQKIEPDPSDDNQFTTLVSLKAACLLDQGKYRTQSLIEGIKAVAGPASLAVAGNSKAFQVILEKGPCATYTELKDQNNFGDFQGIHAILSPFNGNIWSPDDSYSYNNDQYFGGGQ